MPFRFDVFAPPVQTQGRTCRIYFDASLDWLRLEAGAINVAEGPEFIYDTIEFGNPRTPYVIPTSGGVGVGYADCKTGQYTYGGASREQGRNWLTQFAYHVTREQRRHSIPYRPNTNDPRFLVCPMDIRGTAAVFLDDRTAPVNVNAVSWLLSGGTEVPSQVEVTTTATRYIRFAAVCINTGQVFFDREQVTEEAYWRIPDNWSTEVTNQPFPIDPGNTVRFLFETRIFDWRHNPAPGAFVDASGYVYLDAAFLETHHEPRPRLTAGDHKVKPHEVRFRKSSIAVQEDDELEALRNFRRGIERELQQLDRPKS